MAARASLAAGAASRVNRVVCVRCACRRVCPAHGPWSPASRACSARPTAPVGTKAVKPYGTSAPADPQRGQTKRHALLAPARRARAARPASRVSRPPRERVHRSARAARTHTITDHASPITHHLKPYPPRTTTNHEPREARSPATLHAAPAAGCSRAGCGKGNNMLVLKKHAVRAVSLTLRTPCRARRIASQRSLR